MSLSSIAVGGWGLYGDQGQVGVSSNSEGGGEPPYNMWCRLGAKILLQKHTPSCMLFVFKNQDV